MKKQVVLYGALGLLISVSAQADFQYELDAGYIDYDANGGVDDEGFLIAGSVYLESVDTSGGPLAEATFLDKSSGLTLAYVDIGDTDLTSLSGRYVFDNDYLVEASYADSDDDSAFGLNVGKYLTEQDEVVLAYSQTDDSDQDKITVNLHAFRDIDGTASFSFDLGAGYADGPSGSGEIARGGITYYGIPEFGVGISAERAEFGSNHDQVYGLTAEYFFDESTAVSLDYSARDASGGIDVDTLALLFRARF